MSDDNVEVRVRARELKDPEERIRGLPTTYFAFAMLLVFWGLYYIITETDEGYLGDQRTEAALRRAPAKTTGVDGAQLYGAKCVACHQATGAGVSGVFPPLAGSEWVTGDGAMLAKLVLLGVNGEIEVKGQKYNGQMPSFKEQLSDDELAGVLSHVRAQWGNTGPPVEASAVKAARSALGSRSDPWKGGEELKAAK